MSRLEMASLLERELASLALKGRIELVKCVQGEPEVYEVRGPDDALWQIEVEVIWDGHPGGTIRIIGSIDDGGINAFFPVTRSILVAEC